MTREDHYLAGKTEGERWADEDVRNGMREYPNHRAVGYRGDAERAHMLGFARGYRQVVRTLRAGRWGT